jgi:hypothetical protein
MAGSIDRLVERHIGLVEDARLIVSGRRRALQTVVRAALSSVIASR